MIVSVPPSQHPEGIIMKKSQSIILVTALTLFLATGALAQNVLINGDFEAGDISGWEDFGNGSTATVTVESANGPSAPGMYAAYMSNYAEGFGLVLKQPTAVGSAAEGEVEFSFDIMVDPGPGGVVFFEVFAEQEGVGIIGGSGLQGPFFNTDWATISGSFMAPAGTDFLTAQFAANTGAFGGSYITAYVDNVVVEQPGVVATEAGSLDQVKALFR